MKRRRDITLDVRDEHVVETIRASLRDSGRQRQTRRRAKEPLTTQGSGLTSVAARRAFTLVELLVVVAIVGLLVGILLPSLAKAKDLAVSTKCLTQLRGLGQACHIYAPGSDGRLPSATDTEFPALDVRAALTPFVNNGEMFLCSRDPEDPPLPEGSYDWRFTEDSECSLAGASLASISQPSATVLGGDRRCSSYRPAWVSVVFPSPYAWSITENAQSENLWLTVRWWMHAS